jgi:hypothetical protein
MSVGTPRAGARSLRDEPFSRKRVRSSTRLSAQGIGEWRANHIHY